MLVVAGGLAAGAQASPSSTAAVAGQRYLLALGDSLAAGYQPSNGSAAPPIDPNTGFPDRGYPGGYASDLAAERHLRLMDLACPGETTQSMVSEPAQARCAKDYREELGSSSQLTAALEFLDRHRGAVALVTFDLGANDLERCVAHGLPEAGCLRAGAASVARELPPILARLKGALAREDPGAALVGMDYYDPFLGLDFVPGGTRASAEAFLSLVLVDEYDSELSLAYRRAKVPLAQVATAFGSGASAPPLGYGSRQLPRNVGLVCRWTWMCPLPGSGRRPDIHANDAGYRVIARAFEAVLGRG